MRKEIFKSEVLHYNSNIIVSSVNFDFESQKENIPVATPDFFVAVGTITNLFCLIVNLTGITYVS